MFPILSVKDLSEFVDLANRFAVDRVYMTIFGEDRRPGFPDPARPQEEQISRFLTMILTAPAYLVEGHPTVIRFWTTRQVAPDGSVLQDLEMEIDARREYLAHVRAVETTLSITTVRGYLTFLGDPSIIQGVLGGLDPALVEEAREAVRAEFGAMAGSEVTRDQIEAEKPAEAAPGGLEALSEAPEDPEEPLEPPELPQEPEEAPPSDAVSLPEPPETEEIDLEALAIADAANIPPPPANYDDCDHLQDEAEEGDDPPAEDADEDTPAVKTLADLSDEDGGDETPSLEDRFN